MKKLLISILLLLFLLILTFIMVSSNSQKQETKENPISQGPQLIINNTKINVEFAVTSEEQEKGLMFRESLCDNCGMLFVFEDEEIHNFWMRNTLISLDIMFIAEDGKIVEVIPNMPTDPCIGVDFSKQDCITPVASSQTPQKYVLEVNAGFSKKHDIKVGDFVEGFRPVD